MQRRAAAMYVLLFLVIAVGALGFITLTDGPSASMDDPDYELTLDDSVTIDGVEYQLTSLGEFTAQLTYVDEAAELSATFDDGDMVNITGTDYRVEVPDVDDPDNVTLVETYPEHDRNTTEDDEGNTLVQLDDGSWISEEEYLEQEYGPRDEIVLSEGDTFEFIPEEAEESVEATVDEILPTGFTVTWTGQAEQTVLLQRNAVNTIGDTDFGTNFIGQDAIQLTQDIDAFESHLEAHEVWDERYQGFWGVGVLSILAAVLIGALSYLPRRR